MKARIQISKPIITREEIKAITSVLKTGNLSQGPIVKEFEEKFAKLCGTKYAVATNSGTSALHCALFALGIKPGDEVITTPFTFVATANSIIMAGAKPVFADIKEDDFCLDPKSVIKNITKKTKAIIPVDLFGQIYDVPELTAIAKKHNLKIVEDACQAVDAEYKGKKAGVFGDAAAFSLYATKNICTGIGGMITTNNKNIAEQAKLFRHHGQDEKTQYDYIIFGYNYRMMDAIAAMGLVQLKKLDFISKTRNRNAEKLTKGLSDIKGLVLPKVKPNYKHVWHQYTITVTPEFKVSRDQLIEVLDKNGIQAKVYYPKPLHLFPQFNNTGYKKGSCPVAEKLASSVLSLPIHPLVTKQQINYIISTIKNI